MRASRSIFQRVATRSNGSIGTTFRPLSRVSAFHSSASLAEPPSANETSHQWADPLIRQYRYWNREESTEKNKYSYLIEISPDSIQREARILSLSSTADSANRALHKGTLPVGSQLLGVGQTPEDFEKHAAASPNILFVSPSCPNASVQVPAMLKAYPTIEWVHVRSAGIDFVVSDELNEYREKVQFTNAKGQFSSSLAEYVMMACSYFAKDLPLLMKNKKNKVWDNYDIEELRGKTMGIVGYGDIGRACAKMASVYGMRIVALRRHPYLSRSDDVCDVVYGRDVASLHQLMSESDFIVCSAPSTIETRGMVSAEAFDCVKKNAVFINLGRGPVVDEGALIKALETGKLKGAALDVFSQEPLPPDNKLWELENVLISPHNMDKTQYFMDEATEFFVNENLPRFICGEELLNPVDVLIGY